MGKFIKGIVTLTKIASVSIGSVLVRFRYRNTHVPYGDVRKYLADVEFNAKDIRDSKLMTLYVSHSIVSWFGRLPKGNKHWVTIGIVMECLTRMADVSNFMDNDFDEIEQTLASLI